MTGNEYQELAARTIDPLITNKDILYHSLHGMVGEMGEIHSLYQKKYQGHTIEDVELQLELGDLLWFIAEFCTIHGWNLEDIMDLNIKKLKKRYPNGFEKERSLHREEENIGKII